MYPELEELPGYSVQPTTEAHFRHDSTTAVPMSSAVVRIQPRALRSRPSSHSESTRYMPVLGLDSRARNGTVVTGTPPGFQCEVSGMEEYPSVSVRSRQYNVRKESHVRRGTPTNTYVSQ